MDESRTFAQAVYARLAGDILNGHLAPGTRLRLQTMCDTYHVSMSPLREALAALAGRGLVVQEGQRGFRVAPASADDKAPAPSASTTSRFDSPCVYSCQTVPASSPPVSNAARESSRKPPFCF